MAILNGARGHTYSPYLRLETTVMNQDVGNNRTQLRVKLYLVVDHTPIDFHMHQTGRISVTPGGATDFTAPSRYIGGTGTYLLKEYWVWVPHNNDGTRRVSISAYFNIAITWSGRYISRLNVDGNVDLPNIPRGTDITSVSVQNPLKPNTTNYLNIRLNVKVPNASHYIAIYDRGNNVFLGEWQNQSNPTRLTLNTTHVERMLNRMADRVKKDNFYITVSTYQGDKFIQRKERNFNAEVDSSVVPVINSTFLERVTTGYDATLGLYVQNVTKVKARFSSNAVWGSYVKSRKITIRNGNDVTEGGKVVGDYFELTSNALKNSGTYTVTYEITDARGRTTRQTRTFTSTAYQPPKVESFWAYRQNGRINLTFRRSYSSLNKRNRLSITVRAKPKNGYQSTIYSTTTYTESQTQTFSHSRASETQSYDYVLTLTDRFNNKVEAVTNIGTGHVLMAHWEDKATGFGMFPSKRGISVKDEIYMTEEEIPLIESGSNSNGIWIKFYDGTLLCAHTISVDRYRSSQEIYQTWIFPRSFASEPVITVTSQFYKANTNIRLQEGFENRTKDRVNIVLADINYNLSSTSRVGEVGVQAIGRWK